MLDPRLIASLKEAHESLARTDQLLSSERLAQCYSLFRTRFGPDILRKLEGEELLKVMHGRATKDSLAYWLEFKNDNDFPAEFGSIAGGSSLKFGLYWRKETGVWMTGSTQNQKQISQAEAVAIATNQRDQLLASVELLNSLPENASDSEYATLQEQMNKVSPDASTYAWGHKYLSLLFPTKLDDYHNADYQRFYLITLLQLPPTGTGLYAAAGRYVQIASELGMPLNHLTTILNKRNSKPHAYWRIGTSLGEVESIWELMKNGNFVAIGWDALGNLADIPNDQKFRDTLRQALETKYQIPPNVASRKAGEIRNFYTRIAEDDIVLAAEGKKILGIGRVTGTYQFDPTSRPEAPHRRVVTWLSLDPWEISEAEGLRTTVVEINDPENLVEIERRVLAAQNSSLPPHSDKISAGQRNFWWVNQGKTYELAQAGGFIWAPKKDKSNSTPFHWSNVNRVSPGDIVFNYAKGLQAVSLVTSAPYNSDRGALRSDWGTEGWRADLSYHQLTKPVPIAILGPNLRDLQLEKSPIDSDGEVNQGYLYQLNPHAVDVIVQAIGIENLPPPIRAAFALHPSPSMPKPISDPRLPAGPNLILFGPPGTGKTYHLRKRYFEIFTDRHLQLTAEEQTAVLVKDLAWWEVIAMALLDTKDHKANVANILAHPLVEARRRNSNNKNPSAMLWSSLQTHAKADCPNVNYASRIEPLVFWKDESSIWSIDAALAHNEVPDLAKRLEAYRNPPPQIQSESKRYTFTTFHQSFSYEDFVEGIKPKLAEDQSDGDITYQIRDGIFKEICAAAKANPNKPYALFIDEINRGNVASIFGELITLIEPDKRLRQKHALTVTLPYSREEFGVPDNLYIIGTMNTADRSVEALDTALRRRFIFEEMRPDVTKITQPDGLDVDLSELFTTLNSRLERLLDHDHCIGHSYFMGLTNLADLRQAFANKILPLLREYFYGNPAKIGLVLGEPFIKQQSKPTDFAKGDWGQDDPDDKAVYQFTDIAHLTEADFKAIYA